MTNQQNGIARTKSTYSTAKVINLMMLFAIKNGVSEDDLVKLEKELENYD